MKKIIPLFLLILILIITAHITDKKKGENLNYKINYVVFHSSYKNFYIFHGSNVRAILPKFKEDIYLPTIYSYDSENGYVLFSQGIVSKPINLTKNSNLWIGSKEGYINVKPLYNNIAMTVFNGYIYYISSVDEYISVRKVNIKTYEDTSFVNIKNLETIKYVTRLAISKNHILIKGRSDFDTQNETYNGYIYTSDGNLLYKLNDIGDIVIDDLGNAAWLDVRSNQMPLRLKVYFYDLKSGTIKSCNAFSPKIDFQFDYDVPRVNIISSGKIAVWFYAVPRSDIRIVLIDIKDKLIPQQIERSFRMGKDRIFVF